VREAKVLLVHGFRNFPAGLERTMPDLASLMSAVARAWVKHGSTLGAAAFVDNTASYGTVLPCCTGRYCVSDTYVQAWRTLTYKIGFIVGLAFGAVLWLPESGTIQSSADVVNLARYLLAFYGFVSLIIAVVSAFRRRSAISHTIDGLIYGVTTSFGLLLAASGEPNLTAANYAHSIARADHSESNALPRLR